MYTETEHRNGQLFILFDSYEELEDGSLAETKAYLPARYEVCDFCRGTGKSSAYLGDWTGSEWEQEDWEFKEDYVAGKYDKTCPECHGQRVVAVPDDAYADELEYRAVFKEYYRRIREEYEDARTMAAESGWY